MSAVDDASAVAASAPPAPVLRSSAPVYLEFRHISVQLKVRGPKRMQAPPPLQLHRPVPALGENAIEYPPPLGEAAADRARPPPLRSLQLSAALPSPPLFSASRPQPTLSEKHGPIVRDAQSAPGAGGAWADLPPRRKHRQREGFTPASEDDDSRERSTPPALVSPAESPPIALSSASAAAAVLTPPAPASSFPRPRSLASSPHDAGKQFILKDVSGYAMPGQLTAIMGASGAGKTTLLNVLSGRHSSSTSRLSSGTILLNARPVPYSSLSRASAFVQQNDLLLANLTVAEIITFAAVMKLSKDMSYAEKQERVQRIIRELGLDKCKDFCVGASGAGDAEADGGGKSSGVARQGISGGQQRRVQIGTELITEPRLVFLDEPTSGLDSSTAFTIVALLKQLASRGRTIVLTIHSPSTKIFALFDRLLLLTPFEGGARLAFQGPANEVLSYFDSRLDLGVERVCASLGRSQTAMTVADWLMAMLQHRGRNKAKSTEGHKRTPSEIKSEARLLEAGHADEQRIDRIVCAYASNPDSMPEELVEQLAMERRREEAAAAQGKDARPGALLPGSSVSLPWHTQFWHLTHRSFLTHLRSLPQLRARLFTNVFLGLFVGLLYLHTDRSSPPAINTGFNQTSIFNRVGFIFFVVGMQALITLVTSVLTFTEERSLFCRESSSKLYSTSAYFLSKMIVEIPLGTAFSVAFGAIGYAMVNMNADSSHFIRFLVLLSLLGHCISSIGLLLGAAIPLPIVAVMLCPLTVVPFMLTSGFFLNLDTMPLYIAWLATISPHRYAFAALMALEFGDADMRLHCDPAEMSVVTLEARTPSQTPESFSYCSMIKGTQVLDLLSLPHDCYANSVMALCIIAIIFRVMAFIVLTLSLRENRLKIKSLRAKAVKATKRAVERVNDWRRGGRPAQQQQQQQQPEVRPD